MAVVPFPGVAKTLGVADTSIKPGRRLVSGTLLMLEGGMPPSSSCLRFNNLFLFAASASASLKRFLAGVASIMSCPGLGRGFLFSATVSVVAHETLESQPLTVL